jgi:hypothetical protein
MKQIALAAALLSMAVCVGAAAEEYHASGAPGEPGYFSAPTENGRWVVGYNGAVGESPQQIAEFAMQRAAELAAEQNQEWFAVLSAQSGVVQAGVADDLTVRAGHFLGEGQSLNTFGGEMVPMNVLERWQPRQARQTVLLIQLGSGDSATFPDATEQPQIFPAAGPASAG